ncbi:MAG: SMC-Scp complex subunit ScpB [Elusimicrobia bacterium]|nr:SMC-Scp complex subunit ScpB [Elusimicrobiota bacterium]
MSDLSMEQILETLLFASDEPLTLARLREILTPGTSEPRDDGQDSVAVEIKQALAAIRARYSREDSPVVILEVAEGYQFATNPRYAAWIKKLFKDRTSFRLSQAALETLAIISYRQPITRAEIEEIRGVEVIAALETLLEKNLVRVSGRKETVGRPILYATTPEFLRQFGLRSLQDLPVVDENASQGEEAAPFIPDQGAQNPMAPPATDHQNN